MITAYVLNNYDPDQRMLENEKGNEKLDGAIKITNLPEIYGF